MEAISNLREPGGSNKTSIAAYIEVTVMDHLETLF